MIADRMNRERIDSPRFYHYAKMGRPNPLSEQKNVWGSSTVIQLIRNQVYIGNMVQGKRQVISFKTKKLRQISPEDWIIVTDTHEPLIDRELWNRVQKKLITKHRVHETKKNTVGLFAGILKCSDCGSSLAYTNKHLKNSDKGVYRCSRYNNNGGKACTPHYIDEEDICAFVLHDIRSHALLANEEKEALAKRLLSSMKKTHSSETHSIRAKIRETENRLSIISSTLKNLYVDKCTGKIPESVFFSLMNDFTKEQNELNDRLPKLQHELSDIHETTDEIEYWLSLIGSYTELTILDRATVTGLIESITVSERETKNNRKVQELVIEYRFIGNLLSITNPDGTSPFLEAEQAEGLQIITSEHLINLPANAKEDVSLVS